MHLIRSAEDFTIARIPRPGFPILLWEEMRGCTEANGFLRHYLMRGQIGSEKSWEVIGRTIYDYFGFLEAHDLAWDQAACYSSEDDDGEVYWWTRSRSTKTDEGKTEWMIPEAGVLAVRGMERWAEPYHAALRGEIKEKRAVDVDDPAIAVAQEHGGALFVGRKSQDCKLSIFSSRQRGSRTAPQVDPGVRHKCLGQWLLACLLVSPSGNQSER
ncbi:hypothetical protein [Massilia sp. TWR1-2-2]|uniref:hypothetical protein n=1 Tax=Massilia sp. TWR1-2-2 TaxID=2804584 RepID=UPI003CF21D85